MDEEKVKKKLKEGWIKSWMMIEVLATSEEATKEALKHHVKRMGNENKTLLIKTDFQDVQEIEKPVPQVEKGYSQVVELELLTETFDKLMFLTMNYGPSAVEILEPSNIKMDMGEAQGIINSIASMIHKFAAAGIGGVVINR